VSKAEQFEGFRPSFASVGFGWPPPLFEQAFNDGADQIRPMLGALIGDIAEAEGVVGLGVSRSLRFGHFPHAHTNIPDILSGEAAYRLVVMFGDEEKLKSVQLTLFLLNPRVILTDKWLIPARRNAKGRFEDLTPGAAACGLFLTADPTLADDERFQLLKVGIPDAAFAQIPSGGAAYSESTLVSRFDLSIEWKDDALAKHSLDLFGRAVGTPGIMLPDGIAGLTLQMFSSELPDPVGAFMDTTRTAGFELRHEVTDGIQIILGAPSDAESRRLLDLALAEFNLAGDFTGILFEGIRLHWLDDDQNGQEGWPSVGISLTALSFNSGGDAKNFSKWYTSFEVAMPSLKEGSYLGMFTDARFRGSVAEDKLSNFTLSGVFKALDQPYAWLSGRRGVLSVQNAPWKDDNGDEHEAMSVSLGLEAIGDDVFATLNKDSPVAMPQDVFSTLAVGLTLAPIVLAGSPVNAPEGAHAANEQTRGYFVPVRSEQGLLQLYGSLALGWFFSNAVQVDELRVVGVRIQRQPAVVTVPNANPNEYQTALLFDYEADFRIAIDELEIETARPLTARVDGSGFFYGDDKVTWVQVPKGLRELSVADPSLWKLGPFGRFLKIVDMSMRRTPRRELVVRLRLMGNTDIITAGDFVFVIPLEGGDPPSIEAFPSKVTVDIPGVVKGTGTLVISKDDTGRTVIGSLDLVFPSGFRMFGAVRVSEIPGGATATIFSSSISFKPPVPVFGTGLGWTGVEGIFATHMKRNEPARSPAVPPALAWLESVDGDVIKSVKKKAAWSVARDHSTIGLGVMLEFMVSGDLANMNAMLAVEQPGPRILIFSKVNLVEEPIDNKKASGDLKRGIIGVLDIDLANDELTLSALADIGFKDFIKLRAPLQLYFNTEKAKAWHLYLGTHDDPIAGTLDLFGLASIAIRAYFMASGDVIKAFPVSPTQKRDLPGFAIAMGFGATVKLGGGSLYARGDLDTYLVLSLSKGLFALGSVLLSGELRLFIVSVGASAQLTLEYSNSIDGTQGIFVTGSICGHYKNFFIEVEGCLTLSFGARIPDPTSLWTLSNRAVLLAGADVSLRGQGRLGPIDVPIGEAVEVGGSVKIPVGVPLDTVIALSMAQPPAIGPQPKGFAIAGSTDQNDTRFNIGSRVGQYVLHSVTLKRRLQGGGIEEVDYSAMPARWWGSGQSSKGGQLTPKTLALLTRDPLSVKNAVVDPAQLEAWIDAVLGNVCKDPIEPQPCWYALGPEDVGVPADGTWWMTAVLRDAEIEGAIGRSGATRARASLNQRAHYGNANDPIPGFPRFPGSCRLEKAGESAAAVLSTYSKTVLLNPHVRVSGAAIVRADMLPDTKLDLLLAHSTLASESYLRLELSVSDGRRITIPYSQLLASGAVGDLTDEAIMQQFHEGAAYWQRPAEAFAALHRAPQYTGWTFSRIQIHTDSIGLTAGTHPDALMIGFDGDMDVNSDVSLIIGGLRFIPLAEGTRYENDLTLQQKTIADLQDYFDGKPVPLLEPDSEYELEVAWDSKVEGRASVGEVKRYEFKTTDEPPSSVIAYLLATFPQANERFHSPGDNPGFALGSADALRMLAKFPEARLKVTVTEDGGTAVTDSTGTLPWHRGVLVTPADLVDPLAPAPKGFILDSFASLPSALREAIFKKIKDGSLRCLGNPTIPAGGLWIGLDVALRSLAGYRVRIEVVRADGTEWPWASTPAEPFLQWQFSTALHTELSAHAVQFAAMAPRHRVMAKELATSFVSSAGSRVADKVFEDTIAEALAERSDRSTETAVTILWHVDPQTQHLKANALLLESREPIARTTRTVRIGLLSDVAPDTSVAEPQDVELQSINLVESKRVTGIIYSESGFAALLNLDDNTGDVEIVFERHSVDRVPAALPAKATVAIAAGKLAQRQMPYR